MDFTKCHRRKRGFTLLELLLVLGVLITVLALAMPALYAPLDNHRLRRSGDLVRARWAKARAQAMQQGRTYVFRYTPGTENFTVEPWLSGDDYLESNQLLSYGVDATGNSLAQQVSLGPTVESLPENVSFLASETRIDIRAEVLAATNPDQAAAAQLSRPIFFYPDGTTSTARLVLGNQRERFVTLTLRGLTGVAYVSDLQTRDELQFE